MSAVAVEVGGCGSSSGGGRVSAVAVEVGGCRQ